MSMTAWLGIDNPFLVPLDDKFSIHRDVKEPWLALQRAAQKDGLDCQLVSSHRDFTRQLAIWNRKWRGEATLYDAQGKALNHSALSDDEKIDAILTWSALPGGSRHHWGSDIDVFDKQAVNEWGQPFELVDSEYRESGPCFGLACWMDENLHRFGFSRPFLEDRGGVAVELWHLTHTSTASTFEQQRRADALADALKQADMEGKEAVLKRIDSLFERYVLNKGIR
ncbi:MAG: D-alanyl-D-alanine carboxypeptidase [Alteromonadaceae bacterium]|nr:D-alanyl-D-alanine carboxypeptidase [Alteromonadaceae bacterium]